MSMQYGYGLLGLRKAWSPSHDEYMLQLLIELQNCGKTTYNLFRYEVYKTVTQKLNEKFGANLEESQIKIRYNAMKKDYGVVKALLGQPGFQWDEKRQMVVADDKVWDKYTAVKSEARPYRWRSFPPYDHMAIIFEESVVGDVGSTKVQFPGKKATEEGNSDPETVQSSEPTKQPAQIYDDALGSDSTLHAKERRAVKRKSTTSGFQKSTHVEAEDSIENAFQNNHYSDRLRGMAENVNGQQSRKRKPVAVSTPGCKNRTQVEAEDSIENALNETPSATRFEVVQKNVIDDRALYQNCLEELQRIEEINDAEFTMAVNALKDDKNAIAFMTIRGPRRLIWLRSILQVY